MNLSAEDIKEDMMYADGFKAGRISMEKKYKRLRESRYRLRLSLGRESGLQAIISAIDITQIL